MSFVEETGKIGVGSLWLIGWYIYYSISSVYCFTTGVNLYALFTALQGGDVPQAYATGIDFCYGIISQFY